MLTEGVEVGQNGRMATVEKEEVRKGQVGKQVWAEGEEGSKKANPRHRKDEPAHLCDRRFQWHDANWTAHQAR